MSLYNQGGAKMNFNFYLNSNGTYNAIIILKTSEAPFEILDSIAEYLSKNNFSGNIIIDQLLHSGNNNERFIVGNFDGKQFDTTSFRFEKLKKQSPERKYMCEYLRSDDDIINFSILTTEQKNLIKHGYNI